MSRAICNGVSINYRCVGAGKDVVLIHGLAANHAFWNMHVLLTLSKKFRVTIYDLRGHGYSDMPKSGYTSEDMADELHLLLNKVNVSKAHLVGHSFGGVVALQYAAKHPDRVSSLTLADSRVRAVQPDLNIKNWSNGKKVVENLKKFGFSIPENESESGIWLLEQLASPKWQKMRHELKGTPLSVPFGGWNGGRRMAEQWLKLLISTTAKNDFTSIAGLTQERLSSIHQPIQAIYGEVSPVISSLSGLKNCIPNLKTDTISNAGHFFPLTFPKLFASMVSQFIEESVFVERRMYERISLRFRVDLIGNDGFQFMATTVNVSTRGLLIESPRELKIGSDVEIIAKLEHNNRIVEVGGTVVRMVTKTTSHYKFGIKYASEVVDIIPEELLIA